MMTFGNFTSIANLLPALYSKECKHRSTSPIHVSVNTQFVLIIDQEDARIRNE